MSNSAALSEPAAATFDIPVLPDDERWEEVPWRDSRHGVTSYTALAEEQLQQEELTWAATQPDQSTQPVQPTQAQGFASQEKGADRNAAIPNFTDSLSSEIRFSDDEDDIFWEALTESFLVDADKASNLGTAFHLLARCAVSGGRGVLMPTDERISCIAQRCGLGEDAQRRLHAALERWTASEIAASLAHYASIQPETPFFVLIDDTPTAPEDTISQTPTPMNDGGLEGSGGSEEDWQTSAPGLFDSTSWQGEVRDSAKRKSQKTDTPAAAEPLYLEGAIDLLAYDERGQGRALVVDYKTGGHEQESAEQLQAKHALQASCYAYAVLRQGFARVEVVFVRVERPNPAAPDQPQCVCYTFEASQLPALAASIRTAHYSSKSA